MGGSEQDEILTRTPVEFNERDTPHVTIASRFSVSASIGSQTWFAPRVRGSQLKHTSITRCCWCLERCEDIRSSVSKLGMTLLALNCTQCNTVLHSLRKLHWTHSLLMPNRIRYKNSLPSDFYSVSAFIRAKPRNLSHIPLHTSSAPSPREDFRGFAMSVLRGGSAFVGTVCNVVFASGSSVGYRRTVDRNRNTVS